MVLGEMQDCAKRGSKYSQQAINKNTATVIKNAGKQEGLAINNGHSQWATHTGTMQAPGQTQQQSSPPHITELIPFQNNNPSPS